MANNEICEEGIISYHRRSGLKPVSRTPSCASNEPPTVRIETANPLNVNFKLRPRGGGRVERGIVEAAGAVGGNGDNDGPLTLEIGNEEVGVTEDAVPPGPGHGHGEVGVTNEERTQAGVRE